MSKDALQKVFAALMNWIINLDCLNLKHSLQKHRTYTDMIFIYKALHSKINCEPEDFEIVMSHTCTRGEQCGKLVQRRPPSSAAASPFNFHTPSTWNKLPSQITNCRSLSDFKSKLMSYLLNN